MTGTAKPNFPESRIVSVAGTMIGAGVIKIEGRPTLAISIADNDLGHQRIYPVAAADGQILAISIGRALQHLKREIQSEIEGSRNGG